MCRKQGIGSKVPAGNVFVGNEMLIKEVRVENEKNGKKLIRNLIILSNSRILICLPVSTGLHFSTGENEC